MSHNEKFLECVLVVANLPFVAIILVIAIIPAQTRHHSNKAKVVGSVY